MIDVPTGWFERDLGSLGVEVKGNITLESGTTYELYSVPAFADGVPEVVDGSDVKSGKRPVQPGDLLICKINPRINRVWIVGEPRDSENQVASTEYLVLRMPESEPDITRRFVMWYLRSPRFRSWIKLNVEGATGSHTRAKSPAVLRQKVPIAPLDEQQRIVETIEEQFSRLDAGIGSLQRARRNVFRMRASVLKAAADGELVGSTRGSWETATIREVAIRVDYGSSAKAYADIEGVPMLRMGNIRDGRIVLEDLKFLPSDHPDAAKFSLSAGDVLFNRTNSAELVGKSAVATGQHEGMSFASYLIRIRFGPAVVPEFVGHVINGPLGRTYVARVRSQQVGQANVNGTKLAAFPLPIPPIEQQRKIVAEVDRQFSLIDAAEAAVGQGVARAGMLRQSVLLEAFSGGLRPGSSGSIRGASE